MNEISAYFESQANLANRLLEDVGYGRTDPGQRRKLGQIAIKLFLAAKHFGLEIRCYVHPAIAVIDCILEEPGLLEPIWRRLRLRLCRFALRRVALAMGDCPGANDALMVRWFWTHDEKYLAALVAKSQRIDVVGESCRWMLHSVAERHGLVADALDTVPRPHFGAVTYYVFGGGLE